MSRSGRPSARGAHKRNLIGPNEFLRLIEESGGIPDDVLAKLKSQGGPNPRADAANETIAEALEMTGEQLTEAGIEHEPLRRADRSEASLVRDMAWLRSVLNSMKESVPREQWCRHMRAADPKLTEVATMANLTAGVWKCVVCMREAGPDIVRVNPWPDECDLCGATVTTSYEVAFDIPGCYVNCCICDECVAFRQS